MRSRGEWAALSPGWQSSLSLRPYWQFTQHDPERALKSVLYLSNHGGSEMCKSNLETSTQA